MRAYGRCHCRSPSRRRRRRRSTGRGDAAAARPSGRAARRRSAGKRTCGRGIYISGLMTRRFAQLAWAAAACTYLLIILGAIVRITGSGMGCGDHWPLCNGQLAPDGNSLQHVHWTHRLLAYTLFAYTLWWAARTRGRWAWGAVALVILQVAVGAVMVLLALPPPWQAVHVAVGAAVWAALVLAVA